MHTNMRLYNAISCKLVIIQANFSVRILVLLKRNQLWLFVRYARNILTQPWLQSNYLTKQ